MVVQGILTVSGAGRLCRVTKGIVPSPNSLNALAICGTNAGDKVERVLFVAKPIVRWLMELRNCRNKGGVVGGLNLLRPMLVHSVPQIHKPLASNVIADEDQEEGEESDDISRYVVHVTESKARL